MWLVIDKNSRPFKTREFTKDILDKLRLGEVTVVDVTTMEALPHPDGVWVPVRDWVSPFDSSLEECRHGVKAHVVCEFCNCDIDEQMIIDEDIVDTVKSSYMMEHEEGTTDENQNDYPKSQSVNKADVRDKGYYHLYTDGEKDPVLAKLYINPDAQCSGFGFNMADGGGFLPESDILTGITLVPVDIVESKV